MMRLEHLRILVPTGVLLPVVGAACNRADANDGTVAAASAAPRASSPSAAAASSGRVEGERSAAASAQASTKIPIPEGAYRWLSTDQDKAGGRGASDIEISQTNKGKTFKALSNHANVPATMGLGGGQPTFMLDVWPSGEIKIAIDKSFGKTDFVGLTFKKPVSIKIADEGLILVDHAGVTASDAKGKGWISQPFGQDPWFAFFSK